MARVLVGLERQTRDGERTDDAHSAGRRRRRRIADTWRAGHRHRVAQTLVELVEGLGSSAISSAPPGERPLMIEGGGPRSPARGARGPRRAPTRTPSLPAVRDEVASAGRRPRRPGSRARRSRPRPTSSRRVAAPARGVPSSTRTPARRSRPRSRRTSRRRRSGRAPAPRAVTPRWRAVPLTSSTSAGPHGQDAGDRRRPDVATAEPRPSARRAARRAGRTLTAEISRTLAAAPIPSTSQSAAKPGSGSAMRASPSGISGEARTATPTATAALAAATSTPGHGDAGEGGAGHAEGAERRKVVAPCQRLAGERLPRDRDDGQCQESRRDPERDHRDAVHGLDVGRVHRGGLGRTGDGDLPSA